MKRGADDKMKSTMEQTALHFAASYGSTIAIKEFLKHSRNPNIRTEDGCSSLHLAVLNGRSNTIETLVECECNLEAKGQNGDGCIHYAVFSKKT